MILTIWEDDTIIVWESTMKKRCIFFENISLGIKHCDFYVGY